MGFIIKLTINIIALFFVVNIVPGIRASGWESLVVASVLIGLLNAFVRPALLLLTLPINIMSLGMFTLLINAFMLYLASRAVKGFVIESFWSAFFAALFFSFISFLLNLIMIPKANITFFAYSRKNINKKDENVIDVEGKIVD
ncbi:MAG: phage holin family protein [Candidatus Omnitrophica bacterium]|nr:phage holin family protein [Candidatus Omnitrophota bacterium]MCM8790204.1 phage holin family protein [Candidatus Omnitrophota bacterium]